MSILGIIARAITGQHRSGEEEASEYNRDQPWSEQIPGADIGIRARPPALSDGIEPSSAAIENGIRPRTVSPSSIPPGSSLESPGTEPPLPSSGRIDGAPNQPAISSDEDILAMVRPKRATTRPREVDEPQNETERLQRDLNQARQPAEDRNGRVKSAIYTALAQMGEQANRALASGRPVDEYGLAGIAGKGIGGGAAGAMEPWLDEDYKRRKRMDDLEEQIATTLKIEREQATTAKTKAETEYTQNVRPEVEGIKARAAEARTKPKPFVIAGKRINYRRPVDWQGDPQDWEPFEESVDGEKLVDSSKAPDADGLLPKDKQRAELADKNNRFKSAESQKQRDFTAGQNDKNRALKRTELSERIAARLERDKQAHTRAGQAVTRIKISMANAKVQATQWGVNIDDYIDALSDNDVEVVEK